MADVTRAAVMAAIYNRIVAMSFATAINGATTWRQTSQRLQLFSDVDAGNQPYACLVTHSESDEYRGLGLKRRKLSLGVWCYSRTDNGGIGQNDLDVMMASFEAAFGQAAVDNFSTNQCTLGGLVYWCRIEGRVFKDPGDIDNQAMMIVPLMVEMP